MGSHNCLDYQWLEQLQLPASSSVQSLKVGKTAFARRHSDMEPLMMDATEEGEEEGEATGAISKRMTFVNASITAVAPRAGPSRVVGVVSWGCSFCQLQMCLHVCMCVCICM